MTEKDNEVVKMADGWYCMEIKVIVNKGIFTYFICKLLQLLNIYTKKKSYYNFF